MVERHPQKASRELRCPRPPMDDTRVRRRGQHEKVEESSPRDHSLRALLVSLRRWTSVFSRFIAISLFDFTRPLKLHMGTTRHVVGTTAATSEDLGFLSRRDISPKKS